MFVLSSAQTRNLSMQGKPSVIDALNALLANELAARDQYLIHSRMLADWGLVKAAAGSRTRWPTKLRMPTH